MTEPGYVAPLAPGWWVRTGRVGINASGYNWEVSAVGNKNPGAQASGEYGWVGAATGITPITFDAVGAGNSVSLAANMSLTHTATAGAAVIAWVVFANSTANPSISATYAGNAMTQHGSTLPITFDGSFSYYATCFSYPIALLGARTIVVTPAATSYIKGNSVSYLDVSTFGTPVTGTGTAASMTLSSVSSATGRRVINMFAALFSTATVSAYNQTSRWNNNAVGTWTPIPVLFGDAAGAATVSFSATQNTATAYAAMAIDLS